jgi:hypothetical protein
LATFYIFLLNREDNPLSISNTRLTAKNHGAVSATLVSRPGWHHPSCTLSKINAHTASGRGGTSPSPVYSRVSQYSQLRICARTHISNSPPRGQKLHQGIQRHAGENDDTRQLALVRSIDQL